MAVQATAPGRYDPVAAVDEVLEVDRRAKTVCPGVGEVGDEAAELLDAPVGARIGLVLGGAPLGHGVIGREGGVEVPAAEGLEAGAHEIHVPLGHASILHRWARTGTRLGCSWSGSTGLGWDDYDRAHSATAPPAEQEVRLTTGEAHGDPSILNPEQLLVMAASSCQMMWFLHLAAKARIDVVGYEDDALGVMPDDDPPLRITEITLRPRITVTGEASEDANPQARAHGA